MKIFLISLALCAFGSIAAERISALSPENSAKFGELYKVCIENSKVDKDLVAKARGGDFAEDEHLDAFFTCVFKSAGFIDDEGYIQGNAIKSILPADITSDDIEKVRSACEKVAKEPKEKIAKQAYKCYWAETPVRIQLINE